MPRRRLILNYLFQFRAYHSRVPGNYQVFSILEMLCLRKFKAIEHVTYDINSDSSKYTLTDLIDRMMKFVSFHFENLHFCSKD